ncbi:sulfatase-like hydrolase/transferase [Halomarina oriensis]|uniref:Sulfatase-like hydrolase/transferase n=1 Tax=Halomarina oriensis TaxID=671145 RepID=A0A6B0GGR6_9EURY|nr:sulfatase-like hydrolase/transferase [Halomarina oriensis]MWG33157.1 sulfatase-like hydrolase/transferase [Halomarina oriensis]
MSRVARSVPAERNVVVLCLDTVRKDAFDAFAPRLRAAADVEYAGCRAASSWSTPSHASMVTGHLPHEHGVNAHAPSFRPLAGRTVFDRLPHHTVGVSANPYAGSPHGFDTLFDEFVDVSRYRRFPTGADPDALVRDHADGTPRGYARALAAVARHDHPLRSAANLAAFRANDLVRHGPLSGPELFDDGARVVERATLDRLEASDEPVAVFCNVMDAHSPLRAIRGFAGTDVPEGWTSEGMTPTAVSTDPEAFVEDLHRYRTLYAAAVDYLDRWTLGFAERLQAATDRETTLVVTADHGENLGYPADDGLFGHVGSLTEALLHVPLVVLNAPESPGVVDGTVSHLDLPYLVESLAAGSVPNLRREHVLAEVLGRTPGNDGLGERFDRVRRIVYDGDRKHEWDDAGESRTLALDADRPCWQTTVDTVDRPDWTADLPALETVRADRATDAVDESVDESVESRLRDLGYR